MIPEFLDDNSRGNFPGGPVVKTLFPLQKARVQSLVGQLRSHRPMQWSKQANKEKGNRREPIK